MEDDRGVANKLDWRNCSSKARSTIGRPVYISIAECSTIILPLTANYLSTGMFRRWSYYSDRVVPSMMYTRKVGG